MKFGRVFWFFLLLVPSGMAAQDSKNEDLDFYLSLALKDAKIEQNLTTLNAEDQKDFWADQLRFEKALLAKKPKAYRAYLKGKYIAYARHQKKCGDCGNSKFYHRLAYYYALNGAIVLKSEPLLSVGIVDKSKEDESLDIPK